MELGRRRVHGWVSGRVQGVFFRNTMRAVAMELGVTGWVRNLPDGRVEFAVEGNPQAVEQMLAWSATGPEYAQVISVEIVDEPVTGETGGFQVRGA